MTGAHVHLLVNHVPILGSLFGSVLFAIALVSRDRQGWARAALLTVALSIAGAIAAFFTGEPAVSAIDGMPRTSGHALEQHHIASLVAISLVGLTALVALVLATTARRRHTPPTRRALTVLLLVTAASGIALSWTGLAGGRINHPEVQRQADREAGPAHPH